LKNRPVIIIMPSFSRQTTMPTVITSKSSSGSRKDRAVGFLKDPVSAVCRPVNMEESWAAYDFEVHAQNCVYCKDPYEVHRSREQLCQIGHRLAQDVAAFLYNRADGKTYSTSEEENKLVQVEIPTGYPQVRGLLKAIERSLRHRSRTPFVSQDRTYYVAERTRTPARSRSVKVEQASKTKSRPRSGEIVDWPSPKAQAVKPVVTTEVNNSRSKRGSLYEADLAAQRRNAAKYSVEVREPSYRDHRLSGYYR
jgi:hypothetical protein